MDEMLAALPAMWKLILGLCGGIATISGAVAVVIKWFSPFKELTKRVSALERLHEEDQKSNIDRFKTDLDAIGKLEKSNEHLCKCMVALMDHAITGNSVDILKKTRNDLQMYLIEK